MSKQAKIQAYVTDETKQSIVKLAKEKERSESYIAGKILDEAMRPSTKILSNN